MRDFTTTVAGVSRNQSIVEQCSEGDEVYLIREPDNKYDTNAIIVHSSEGDLGYIPRERAVSLAPIIGWRSRDHRNHQKNHGRF